jgi:hypothetical protein
MQPSKRLNSAAIPESGVIDSRMPFEAPVPVPVVACAKKRQPGLPKAQILAFHVPKGGIDAEGGQNRVAAGLAPIKDDERAREEDRHCNEERPPLPRVSDHAAESEDQRNR